ncbi:helix-turn-helix transcriptional regulator [Actinomyces howellii]|uniref:Uncharacterized protein n=1 Tax=Actinomyces howellii TaxID=52771 RepID=A0A448HHH2_9ACTO|nr:hypothetical protein [Actinomyces howellii]VEG28543.1 Uncharacterised protein [Actinomyces howellii]
MSDTTPESTGPQVPGPQDPGTPLREGTDPNAGQNKDADPGGGRVWSRPRPTPEQLRADATEFLKLIDEDREIARLLGLGLSPEQAAERTGVEVRTARSIRQRLERGEEVRPVTPKELGWRRAVGQISTEEMMERLRTWPYTFGRIRGYDFWERGSWDDVDSLHTWYFLSDEEYHELRVIADSMPHPPDDPMPWEKKHQQQ